MNVVGHERRRNHFAAVAPGVAVEKIAEHASDAA
jgi:hypothetical protein